MCIDRRKIKYGMTKVTEGIMGKKKEFNFQNRIEELMKATGIKNNYQLSVLCGVDRATVTRWMKPGTQITHENVEKLAKVFNITTPQFYESGFVDRRGDGPSKRLRLLWKSLTERQKDFLVDSGEALMEVAKPYIETQDPSSFS